MAHNADRIPWHLLVSHLEWKSRDQYTDHNKYHRVTNLHPIHDESIEGDFAAFAHAFSQTLNADAVRERAKYPTTYEAPHNDDLVMDRILANKVSNELLRCKITRPGLVPEPWYLEPAQAWPPDVNLGWCTHAGSKLGTPSTAKRRFDHQDLGDSDYEDYYVRVEPICDCVVDRAHNTTSAFLIPYVPNDCFEFEEHNGDSFFNLSVLCIMLSCNELSVILRLCRHPDFRWLRWFHVANCDCCEYDMGWSQLMHLTLRAYICLNVLYSHPDTCPDHHDQDTRREYRDSFCYQYMLGSCTETFGGLQVATAHHREFFGISNGQFQRPWQSTSGARNESYWRSLFRPEKSRYDDHPGHYGLAPIRDFLASETLPAYLPTRADVMEVRGILQHIGRAPTEVVDQIMFLADFHIRGRLKVAGDPLHEENRDELVQYLDECWDLLVRLIMMGNEIDESRPMRRRTRQASVNRWGVSSDVASEQVVQSPGGTEYSLDQPYDYEDAVDGEEDEHWDSRWDSHVQAEIGKLWDCSAKCCAGKSFYGIRRRYSDSDSDF